MVFGVYLDPSTNSGFFAFNLDAKLLGARREETHGASRSSNNLVLSQDGIAHLSNCPLQTDDHCRKDWSMLGVCRHTN